MCAEMIFVLDAPLSGQKNVLLVRRGSVPSKAVVAILSGVMANAIWRYAKSIIRSLTVQSASYLIVVNVANGAARVSRIVMIASAATARPSKKAKVC